MNKICIFTVILLLIPLSAFSRESLHEIKFQLENMDENETLVWCYEIAYRLSNYQKQIDSGEIQAENEVFCNAPPVDSDQIRNYLNKNHNNEYITDNQALKTIFDELSAAYPCSQ